MYLLVLIVFEIAADIIVLNNDNWIGNVFIGAQLLVLLFMLFKNSGIEEHEG